MSFGPSKKGAFAIMILAIVMTLVYCSYLSSRYLQLPENDAYSGELGRWFVVVLFFMPVVVNVLVVLSIRREIPDTVSFYSVTTGLAVLSYLVTWHFYLADIRTDILSHISVTAAALLVGITVALSWLLMQAEHSLETRWLKWLATAIMAKRFQTICLFMGVFLCVTYLLSFALAFHDKASGEKALLQVELPQPQLGESSWSATSEKPVRFIFAEGSALVEHYDDPETKIPPDIGLKERDERRKHNTEALKAINDQMNKNRSRYDRYERVRITLLGHANDKSVKQTSTAYQSNWELSIARTQQVQHLLRQRLEISGLVNRNTSSRYESPDRQVWENIEWVLVPVISDDVFLDAKLKNKLSVEVLITKLPWHVSGLQLGHVVPRKGKGLIDYVYFTIYTITTTGYGDIMPQTAQAKFIVSVANLFEVFFLVIFFNVIVSSGKKLS